MNIQKVNPPKAGKGVIKLTLLFLGLVVMLGMIYVLTPIDPSVLR